VTEGKTKEREGRRIIRGMEKERKRKEKWKRIKNGMTGGNK
jgi:hypothetical protein